MTGTAKTAAISALLFTAIMPAVGAAGKTEIRLRLLNALTGKPYAGRHAGLFGTNRPSGLLRAEDTLFHLQTITGPDGIAHFLIGEPLPYRLIPDVRQNGGCAWHGAPPIITSEVLRSGYVGPNECAHKNQSFHWQDVKAEPGEIILFVVEPRGP
jgi:hypothetical protein